MPELPEVETIRRALLPHVTGRRIVGVDVTVPALRWPLDAGALRDACVGQTVITVSRRGKYLLVELSSNQRLVLHLGMTGAFRICPGGAPVAKHEQVIWRLVDGNSWRFLDARRFGSVVVNPALGPDGLPESFGALGPEPLAPDFSAEYLYDVTRGRARAIKDLLMDQSTVAGIGNIYANEALFRAGLRPRRGSRRLSRRDCVRTVTAIRDVLREAIAFGGTTISDFRTVDGSEGKFRIRLRVYGRTGEPCLRCGDAEKVKRIVQGGRSSFYCPGCQK